MKRKRQKLNTLLFSAAVLALFFAFTACQTDETCRQSKKVEVGMAFYLDTINATTKRWVETKISLEKLSVHGIGTDSLLYREKTVNHIRVPLKQLGEAQTCQFNLNFANQVQDTITVVYQNKLEFLSMECGSIRTHIIDTVYTSGHFIDSITIVNRNVNTQYVENIKLHHIK